MVPFRLTIPTGPTGPAVFSSPHSGSEYPAEFVRSSQLDARTLRSSEDAFVDQLFACAPDYDAPLIAAVAPRAFVDLNRAREELDPAAVAVPRRAGLNPRVSAGLGVIPRVVSEGRVIRSGRISALAAETRLRDAYDPYHDCLERLLRTARTRHGQAFLIDCHSMPHDALRSLADEGPQQPEIILGDRFGTACAPWVLEQAQDAFVRHGFRVLVNRPFAGGYITRLHGQPSKGRHALQIEIDRALYMDEKRIKQHAGFAELQERLRPVIAELAQLGAARNTLAAE
ncbi:N-formylglutamate amidohydrolase [Pontivivens insulae]|uniref:N-formylglutamate amidohydrolase n=1 Tax=Pontivivens insulae TaxID=1639689 RepID=A0A2R8A6C4_9RHOB|nr:N-formylglutamate amidohydrolase [Pontivivens insulae]RED17822.1 N-formylglutamate deformylase [Pontivivens insulae]SPF27712.1 hypothetical protein POI8812_00004 [Pontivivens insulae]